MLGTVPPIFFMKDKASASISEIERLLAIADFGPEEETATTGLEADKELEKLRSNGRIEFMEKTNGTQEEDKSSLTSQPSLFGIDHAALNQRISANKNIDTGRVGLCPNNMNLDKKFEHFRAFMRKRKKINKATRKEAAFYKGELEFYDSGLGTEYRDNDFVAEETDTDRDDVFLEGEDQDSSENIDSIGFKGKEDTFDFCDEPKNK